MKQLRKREKIPAEAAEEVKAKPEKKEKSEGYVLKKNTAMKVLRCILWLLLLFVFVRGVFSIFRQDKEQQVEALIRDFKQNYSTFTNQNEEVMAFAQNFAKEYFTYETRGEEAYKARLASYVSEDFFAKSVFDFKADAEVVYAKAYRLEDYSENQKDVYVLLEVAYTKHMLEDGKAYQTKSETSLITLKVPVYCQEAAYAVECVPMIVTDANNLEAYTAGEYSGTSLPETQQAAMETFIGNFLKAYVEQDASIISYYLDSAVDKTLFAGLDGRFMFAGLEGLKCYQLSNGDILCLAEYSVQDAVNDAKVLQKINISVKNTGEKYYITEMNTRIGNLNMN